MDPFRKIPKKVTKKFVDKVINRQYFHRKTGLQRVAQNPSDYQAENLTEQVLRCFRNSKDVQLIALVKIQLKKIKIYNVSQNQVLASYALQV